MVNLHLVDFISMSKTHCYNHTLIHNDEEILGGSYGSCGQPFGDSCLSRPVGVGEVSSRTANVIKKSSMQVVKTMNTKRKRHLNDPFSRDGLNV